MNKQNLTAKWIVGILLIAVVIIGFGISRSHNTASGSGGKVQIVAAENFWGSLAAQLGGNRVHVTSIVSDPNADPHEYESNTADARAMAAANYVILNGAGYDTWANKLLGANPTSGRRVLTVANLVGKKEGDNPHLWYNPAYVNQAVVQMDHDLIAADPSGKSYYEKQLGSLQQSLSGYQNRIAGIKRQYAGTKVAATEDIFAYLATAAGLNLISPPSFIQAVAEGNDPPTGSVVAFQQQLHSGQVKVLVYNAQTVTPLTTNVKKLAADNDIPIVAVTETIQPPDASFQEWMNAQIINLENALNAQKLGQ
jgi:zinc/manganese transport system substrate-binding protein